LSHYVDLLARLLIASLFAVSGLSKAMDLPGTVAAVSAKLPPGVATPLALAAAFIEVGGALALALGAKARLSAAILAGFTLTATLLFHAFWLLPEGQSRDAQLFQFMKNMAILGGLALVFAHGAGAWSLDARRTGRGRRRSPQNAR
jgi:putative oxidoreductase